MKRWLRPKLKRQDQVISQTSSTDFRRVSLDDGGEGEGGRIKELGEMKVCLE